MLNPVQPLLEITAFEVVFLPARYVAKAGEITNFELFQIDGLIVHESSM